MGAKTMEAKLNTFSGLLISFFKLAVHFRVLAVTSDYAGTSGVAGTSGATSIEVTFKVVMKPFISVCSSSNRYIR